jgi:membrane-bound metal-dependent hydrolase YbcI (DUF457 family)
MALCFAHSAAGYLVYEAVRPAGPHRLGLLAASVLLAGAPDLDFVPGIVLGQPGMWHRGSTHTILAAVVVGAAVALGVRVFRRGSPALAAGLWAAAAYGTHLVVDCITADPRPPYGVQLFWPLSPVWVHAPVAPLREILVDGSSRAGFVTSLLRPGTLSAWLGDAAVLAAAVAGVHAVRWWQGRARVASRAEGPEACAP